MILAKLNKIDYKVRRLNFYKSPIYLLITKKKLARLKKIIKFTPLKCLFLSTK